MGNCTGIFSSCQGNDAGAVNGVVKKVDQERIKKALEHNKNMDSFGGNNLADSNLKGGRW